MAGAVQPVPPFTHAFRCVFFCIVFIGCCIGAQYYVYLSKADKECPAVCKETGKPKLLYRENGNLRVYYCKDGTSRPLGLAGSHERPQCHIREELVADSLYNGLLFGQSSSHAAVTAADRVNQWFQLPIIGPVLVLMLFLNGVGVLSTVVGLLTSMCEGIGSFSKWAYDNWLLPATIQQPNSNATNVPNTVQNQLQYVDWTTEPDRKIDIHGKHKFDKVTSTSEFTIRNECYNPVEFTRWSDKRWSMRLKHILSQRTMMISNLTHTSTITSFNP